MSREVEIPDLYHLPRVGAGGSGTICTVNTCRQHILPTCRLDLFYRPDPARPLMTAGEELGDLYIIYL